MGCGKAHSAKAASAVDEPQWPGDKRLSGNLSGSPCGDNRVLPFPGIEASSALRTAASPTKDGWAEGPAGPCAVLSSTDVRDLVPKPPRPPPPPSVTAKATAEQAIPAVTSPSREAAEVSQIFVAPEGDGASRRAHGALPEPPASVPTDTATLRAAATSAESSPAAEDLRAQGPPEASQPTVATDPSRQSVSLPGAICASPRSPRQRSPRVIVAQATASSKSAGSSQSAKSPVSRPHVGKAFAALGSSSPTGVDIDAAFAALLTSEDDTGGDERTIGSPCTPSKYPLDVCVAPASRVLVLTWARWSRNSLRIKAEARLKAMQHIKHPKMFRQAPRTPPLSPQQTPRGGDSSTALRDCGGGLAQKLGEVAMQLQNGSSSRQEPLASSVFGQPPAPPPTRVGGKRHPAVASRNRTANDSSTQGRLLFDVMAEERQAAAEAQAMKIKLQKSFVIEDAHTLDSKTPGFGIDTPNPWASSSASRMSHSPKGSSAVGSVMASPTAAGQMSPWLLEAEAFVNGEEDCPELLIPTNNAWGFEPGRLGEVPEVADLAMEELDDIIGDADELDQVGIFVTSDSAWRPGVTTHTSDAQLCPPMALATDSRASTATSPAGAIGSRSGCQSENTSPMSVKSGSVAAAAGGLGGAADHAGVTEPLDALEGRSNLKSYTIGEKVSYWSASRGVWLAAVIVEKKSSSVYIIDKQMKGCLAKVRTSELISAAEEKRDPVLRALAAFDCASEPHSGTPRGGAVGSSSRSGTPRGGNSGTPRSRSGTPRSARGTPSSEWQPPMGAPRSGHATSSAQQPVGQGDARGAPAHELEAPLPRRKGELIGVPHKAPTIRAALPPALGGSTRPASRSPRGRIVRDDFSDDSEDD